MNDIPETIEKRLEYLKSESNAIFQTSEIDKLSSYAQGILAGIQQASAWALEPNQWAEPIWCVPGLRNVYDPQQR